MITAKMMILAVQMVTTVFHQYEVGMREACIESKASEYFKGVAEYIIMRRRNWTLQFERRLKSVQFKHEEE